MHLRGVDDLFRKWDTSCVVTSAPGGKDSFPILSWSTWDRAIGASPFDDSVAAWRAADEGGRRRLDANVTAWVDKTQQQRVLAREIHAGDKVAERYVLAPVDGWIAYETPLDEPGWHVATLFVRDDNEQLVLAEVKVFPGRDRALITDKEAWGGAVDDATPEHLRSLGWVLPGQWSGDITGEGSKGITARMLRATLQLGAVQQRVAALVFKAAELTFSFAPEFGALDRPMSTGHGPNDANYALWAARYVDAIGRGSTSPNSDVAKAHSVTAAQVRDRVRIARERELLTGGGHGRQGGTLTEKGRRLLATLPEAPATKKKSPKKKTTTKKGD